MMKESFNSARNWLASVISTDQNNPYLDAFLKQIGGSYTKYDTNNKTYLEQGFGKNPDVYAVIKQMSDKTSSIPWSVKRVKDEQAKTRLDRFRHTTKYNHTPQQYIKSKGLKAAAFEEKELEFPMERPNIMQTWADIKALYETFLSATGNVFFYMSSPENGINAGEPTNLYVLPSHMMQIIVKDNIDMQGVENPISHYLLIEGNSFVRFEAENVIHVKLANPFYDSQGSHLYGLSPLRAALRNIQSSNEAIDNNNRTLLNSGAFGFLHSKGQNVMTDTQAKALKQRLVEMDKDGSRLGQIAATNAEIGFTRIALTTDELKPFDYLKFDQKMICNVLGWETKLLNDDDGAKYDNYKLASKVALGKSIIPHNRLLEEAFNQHFLPRFKGYEGAVLEFEYEDLPEMQPDMKLLVEWMLPVMREGVLNRDEVREGINFPMLDTPEMTTHTVSMSTIPLEEAILGSSFEGELNIDE